MTTLGKLLTLLNVVLSLTFLTWATGLYTNQIFWHTPQNQEGQRVDGLVDQLGKRLQESLPVRDAAERRLANATARVAELEARRPTLLRDYADRLKSLRTGDVTDIQPPVQPLVFTQPDGKLDFKRTGQPGLEFEPGKPALSKAGYEKAIADKIKELAEVKQEINKTIDETEKLTVAITGTKDNKVEAISESERGLRVRWEDAKELVKRYQLEQQFLRSPMTTVTLDNATLKRRQQQLQARLDELNNSSRTLGRR